MLAVAGGTWLAQIAPLSASTFEMVVRSVIGGFGGLVTAILVIFLWNLYRAPYKQRNEARALLQSKIKPLPNREKLIEAIAEARIAVVEYVELMDSLENWRRQHPHTVNVDAMGMFDETQKRYKVALESMEKQITVAGSDYSSILEPLYLFIQSSAIINTSTTENAKTILNFKFRLDKVIRQTVDNIDKLNQQASRKEGSQS